MAVTSQTFMGQQCIPQSFTYPEVFGATFTKLEANLVTDFPAATSQGMYNVRSSSTASGVAFCNVSLEYTHSGWNDNINTQVWLPLDGWNGRLQATGGGGFQTGLMWPLMSVSVKDGYATVSTDGGHVLDAFDLSWTLASTGNINWPLMHDFASVALGEVADIGKAITKEFYGHGPSRSYWNGCSMGGRQALQMAQSYPDAFDGILVAAPAIHLPRFVVAEFWPQMIMHQAGEYPPPCELEEITSAAIAACDELDGVKDGIISYPELCTFDAKSMIGKEIECADTGTKLRISELAGQVAETAWTGAQRTDGSFLWHGLSHEAPLAGSYGGLANTVCDENGCVPQPFAITGDYIKYLLKRDPDFDVQTLRQEDLEQLFHHSQQQFGSIFAADDPDLSEFRNAGGKMIHWHGLADQLIMPNGSRDYYEAVNKLDPDVKDFYRYFEAPAVTHCFGGAGPEPFTALEALVEWVEKGNAPQFLRGQSLPDKDGEVFVRDICAYPQRARYKGTGDIRDAESFECA